MSAINFKYSRIATRVHIKVFMIDKALDSAALGASFHATEALAGESFLSFILLIEQTVVIN